MHTGRNQFGEHANLSFPQIEQPTDTQSGYYVRPEFTIGTDRIRKLIRDGIDPLIAQLDLELAKRKLRLKRRWSRIRCETAEVEYKRMLTLMLWNKNLPHPIVPTLLADELWHFHILDTRAYVQDTTQIFGNYLHHFPYLGFEDKRSIALKQKAFGLTCELYKITFGETIQESVTRRLRSR